MTGGIMQIKRDFYLQQLVDGKQNGLIKIVTGIRRCGKSLTKPMSILQVFQWNKRKYKSILDKVINDYLDNITVADLMQRDGQGNDYVI